MVEKLILYTRVSTEDQGRSMLSLEFQEGSCRQAATMLGATILEHYQEVQSGKDTDRPLLAQAIEQCRLTGAKLLALRADRLSRDDAQLLNLWDSVGVLLADNPHADRDTFAIQGWAAAKDGKLISQRIREALARKREREPDWRPGNPNGADCLVAHRERGRRQSAQIRGEAKADFLQRVKPVFASLLGYSYRAMADSLNAQGIVTHRGKLWTHSNAHRVAHDLAQEGTS